MQKNQSERRPVWCVCQGIAKAVRQKHCIGLTRKITDFTGENEHAHVVLPCVFEYLVKIENV